LDALEITGLDGERGLRLAGELDLRTAPQLTEAFASMRRNGPAKLDLSELTFIDSSGLHAILELASSVDGTGPLVLDGVSATMLRVFEITNLAQHPDLQIRSADGG
jgi:anti-sigma B factor antagonist